MIVHYSGVTEDGVQREGVAAVVDVGGFVRSKYLARWRQLRVWTDDDTTVGEITEHPDQPAQRTWWAAPSSPPPVTGETHKGGD